MFVPIVPFVPRTTVINKTIVYSDIVLSLKELGSNLKITSIENISEYNLESCLKNIFQSNPNVIFNTIQYSQNDRKVYFYTDQEITTKSFEERNFTKYKPITSSSEILEEAKNLLLSEKNKDNNCISLYDVAQLLKKLCYDYDNIKIKYQYLFRDIIIKIFDEYSSLVIYDFDYDNNELKIGFTRDRSSHDYDNIYFTKENEDLYITKSKSEYGEKIFSILCSYLSKLFDELIKFNDYRDTAKGKYDIKSVNSKFGIDISQYGVSIFVKSQNKTLENDFKLFSPSYEDEYSLKCNSSIVNEIFKEKETEIFKRIFVKISDCPEWSQALLYEFRQNQLEEEQKIEDEQKYQEMKRQKKIKLIRKIFPFLKK